MLAMHGQLVNQDGQTSKSPKSDKLRTKYCNRETILVVFHKFEYINFRKENEREHLAICRSFGVQERISSCPPAFAEFRSNISTPIADRVCRLLTVNWQLFRLIKRLIDSVGFIGHCILMALFWS